MKLLHVVHVPFAIPYFIGDQMTYFKENYNYEIHIACSTSNDFINYSLKWKFIPFELIIKRKLSPIDDIISIYKLFMIYEFFTTSFKKQHVCSLANCMTFNRKGMCHLFYVVDLIFNLIIINNLDLQIIDVLRYI